MTRVITFYLPQFHSIPENDEVWGKGFTEWDNVRAAKPFFKEHNQPRIPMNNDYYNLLNEDVILKQTKIAKENNIFGFCIYHYWFSGKKILNKPVELMRDSEKINFPYCICWANENWTDAWVSTGKPKTFLEQKYGDKAEWIEHFNYLATFFKDKNYIVENNKPLLVIYRPEKIEELDAMLDLWDKMAQDLGFDGLEYAYQQIDFEKANRNDEKFKYSIEYQPKYALDDLNSAQESNTRSVLKNTLGKLGLLNLVRHLKPESGPRVLDYSTVANAIVERKPKSEKSVAGMFVGYDDTPRKGKRGMIIQSSPEEFRKYLGLQLKNINDNYSNDLMFMFAWNEWAEGGYLEPDTKYQNEYLKIIKDEINKQGEIDNKKSIYKG